MTSVTTDEIPPGLVARFGLFLARFCIPAWIGAATLFVIVGITEVTRGGFDAATKDTLVSVRFPAFYVCGVILIGVGWLGTCAAGNSPVLPRWRRLTSLLLLTLVLATMAADYFLVYQPLLGMVVPAGQPKSAAFVKYHEASKWINLAGLVMTLITATLINWPGRRASSALAENS